MPAQEVGSSNYFTYTPLKFLESGVSEGCTALREEPTRHGLNFLIYMIPVFGMFYKAYSVISAPSVIKSAADSAPTDEIADKNVNRVVRNLQVSDVVFGLASSVEVAVSLVFGFVYIYLLPFIVFSLVVKTSLLIMNNEGLYTGYLNGAKVEIIPSKKVKEAKSGSTTTIQNVYAVFSMFAYCVPLLGVKVKKELTLKLRAEYVNKDVSPQRQEQIEKIQRAHDISYFIAKGISLSIIMTACGLLMAHPLALVAIGIAVVASSYFSGKIDIVEEYANDIPEWRRVAAKNKELAYSKYSA